MCACSLRTQQGACNASANCFFIPVDDSFGVPLCEVLPGFGFFFGEFDPGSGRTLAACLTHASRAERPFGVLERRTGE